MERVLGRRPAGGASSGARPSGEAGERDGEGGAGGGSWAAPPGHHETRADEWRRSSHPVSAGCCIPTQLPVPARPAAIQGHLFVVTAVRFAHT